MPGSKEFKLNFLRMEQHILLPNTTSIILAQNLYEILFQYVIDPEKEAQLKYFIEKLESHIKSKPRAPFSMPLEELDFLGEGLQELRLLNWMESRVAVVEIELLGTVNNQEEEMEAIYELLSDLFTFNKKLTAISSMYTPNTSPFTKNNRQWERFPLSFIVLQAKRLSSSPNEGITVMMENLALKPSLLTSSSILLSLKGLFFITHSSWHCPR